MDSETITHEDEQWVYYSDREDWKDLKPIPQDEGKSPVVRIAYNQKFQDAFDYFRAVLLADEQSERAFELTKDCVTLNPANYTVWHFRRNLLKSLGKDLSLELQYIREVIEDNPKNYQVWHHRQAIIQWLQDPSQEKRLTEIVLAMDSKNYHAWQHRQWVLKEFGLWENEINFVTKLLEEDVRNNSAWNQRYFVNIHTDGFNQDDTLHKEICFTLDKIKQDPQNESAWSYLRGILHEKKLTKFSEVWESCIALYTENCRSCHLLAFLIELYIEKDDLDQALKICQELSSSHDIIRKSYWDFKARCIAQKQK